MNSQSTSWAAALSCRMAVAFVVLVAMSGVRAQEGLREGDIIFQTSRSAQSLAIQRATNSQYSHMGMVMLRQGRPCVFEAVETVRCTPLQAWIERGIGGHYVAKRLRDADVRLTAAALAQLARKARAYEGRRYDVAFEWTDTRMYCSELVWKIYQQALQVKLGELQRLREFNLDDPIVKATLRQRYGKRIPLEQWVISPVGMYNAAQLVSVLER